MKIETLKDFEALLKVCRKNGVSTISVDGISVAIGDAPEANSRTKQDDSKIESPDALTDEELLMWSVGNG